MIGRNTNAVDYYAHAASEVQANSPESNRLLRSILAASTAGADAIAHQLALIKDELAEVAAAITEGSGATTALVAAVTEGFAATSAAVASIAVAFAVSNEALFGLTPFPGTGANVVLKTSHDNIGTMQVVNGSSAFSVTGNLTTSGTIDTHDHYLAGTQWVPANGAVTILGTVPVSNAVLTAVHDTHLNALRSSGTFSDGATDGLVGVWAPSSLPVSTQGVVQVDGAVSVTASTTLPVQINGEVFVAAENPLPVNDQSLHNAYDPITGTVAVSGVFADGSQQHLVGTLGFVTTTSDGDTPITP